MANEYLDAAGVATLWADMVSYIGEESVALYRFKGSVNAYADLPATPEQGDVYNVAGAYGDYPAGTNWAWTGTAWDALGGEVDLSAFATKDSPAFTGTPTAPTAASGTDTTQIATTAFVQQEIEANAYELPTMDATTKGGATLGHGLTVSDGALSLGPLVESGSGDAVDTQGCALYAVDAQGWAEQVATTGKNLLDLNVVAATSKNNTRTFKDGILTLTASENGTGYAFKGYDVQLPEGTYTFSYDALTEKCTTSISSNTSGLAKRSRSSETTTTFSVDEGGESIRFYFYTGNTSSVTAGESSSYGYPQLEAGSTATEYEPYSGAKPSPSPEYPQEIKVCRGRNLWDGETESGDLNSDGTEHADSTRTRSKYVPVDARVTYSLSENGVFKNYQIFFYDASQAFISGSVVSGRTSFTAPSNAAYLRFYQSNNFDFAHVQLELGSTPTPYVPYGHVGLEVESPNLYGFSDKSSVTNNGITWTGQPDGRYWAKGTATANSFGLPGNPSMADFGKSFIVKLEAGTYTATSYGEVPFNVYSMPLDSASGTALRSYYIDDFTFTLEEPRYIQLGPRISSGTVVDRTYSFAIFRGNSARDYVPKSHTTTPIPLPLKSDGERWAGGLPDGTADALSVDSAGRWEWVCPTDEKVFDGSETWSVTKSGTENWYYSLSGASNLGIKGSSPFLSNQYTGATITNSNTSQGIGTTSTGSDLRVRYGTEQAAADFAASHVTNPLTALYALATPTTEHGYIDLPDLPSGARVSIPELEGFGCSWFIEGCEEMVAHVVNWNKRSRYEDEQIEDAIADLAARVAALE